MPTAKEIDAMHKRFGIDYVRPMDFNLDRPRGWADRDWKLHCEAEAMYKNIGQYRAALMRIFNKGSAGKGGEQP